LQQAAGNRLFSTSAAANQPFKKGIMTTTIIFFITQILRAGRAQADTTQINRVSGIGMAISLLLGAFGLRPIFVSSELKSTSALAKYGLKDAVGRSFLDDIDGNAQMWCVDSGR
jgi:hypothetical protein